MLVVDASEAVQASLSADGSTLARLSRCRLLTLDGRLRRRAASLVEIVGADRAVIRIPG